MADYDRRYHPFMLRGANITRVGDQLTPEFVQYLRNIRAPRIGELRPRPGLSLLGTGDLDAGSTARALWGDTLSEPIQARGFTRFFSTADGKIYIDDSTHSSFSQVGSGYSTTVPQTSVQARPDFSPRPYMFIGDTTLVTKYRLDGVQFPWGIPPPNTPPTTAIDRYALRVIDDTEATTGWTATNGSVTSAARISAAAISHILFDSGTTGFASISPTVMDEAWQEGLRVTWSGGNAETITIESVYPAISSTTIAAIHYDSGSTGLCTIQLAVPTVGLSRNSLIRLNSAENVRVLSVTRGPDAVPSLRASTVGTFSASQTVDGLRSFRAFNTGNHTTAETLSGNYVQIATTASGLATLSKSITVDLSSTNVAANRPLMDEDFIHFSLNVGDWSLVSEIQIQFDIDRATNDFTQNYFYKAIRPPDTLASVKQTSSSMTAEQIQVQRSAMDESRISLLRSDLQLLDLIVALGRQPEIGSEPEKLRLRSLLYVTGGLRRRIDASEARGLIERELADLTSTPAQGPITVPAQPGNTQWDEFFLRYSDFQRVGTDTTRGWRDVVTVRLSINCTAAVNIQIDSLFAGGTYGPDTLIATQAPGYSYIYRYRYPSTGEISNPSPPNRSPEYVRREPIIVTGPACPVIPGGETPVVDIFRFGGTLPGFHQVGSVVATSNWTFTDTTSDISALRQEVVRFDAFNPWPTSDLPRVGIADIIGTRVIRVSGDLFNTRWARATPIIINGVPNTLYTSPETTGLLQLSENAGYQEDVRFELPNPTLLTTPLPCIFGPYTGGASGSFIFALGDPNNPGYFYFTNGNDPNSVSDVNEVEVSGPDEPLVAGVILDNLGYIFSNKRSWRILPSFAGGQSGAGSLFYSQETAMGRGVVGRYAICSGDQIYFVAYDGIYASRGDAAISITDETIAPLFRREGNVYSDVQFGLSPISFAPADLTFIRLTYSKDGLYLMYKGVDGLIYTWYYSFLVQGWFLDDYVDDLSVIIREKRDQGDSVLVGTTLGRVFFFDPTAFDDDGTAINCQLISRDETWGDPRAQKHVGDFVVDTNRNGQVITVGLNLDGAGTLAPSTLLSPISSGSGRTRYVRDIDGGRGVLARSAALNLTWSSSLASPFLYGWEPSALMEEEVTVMRATDWDTAGYEGPKWVQGIRINANTFGVNKSLRVEYDGGITGASLVINHADQLTNDYSFPVPFVAHNLRLRGDDAASDTTPWSLTTVEWIFEPEPPLVATWHTQFTSLDLQGYMHIRDMIVPYAIDGSGAKLTVSVDGAQYVQTLADSGGNRARAYVVPLARKGKYLQFITVTDNPAIGIRIYQKDLEIRAKAWGDPGPYQIFRPFGDRSREFGGARI